MPYQTIRCEVDWLSRRRKRDLTIADGTRLTWRESRTIQTPRSRRLGELLKLDAYKRRPVCGGILRACGDRLPGDDAAKVSERACRTPRERAHAQLVRQCCW
eukprot:6208763-Pleurochrysis_carterae.AAC.6